MRPSPSTSRPSGATATSGATETMQDLTPTPAAEPKAKTLYAFFRGLFSRMAIVSACTRRCASPWAPPPSCAPPHQHRARHRAGVLAAGHRGHDLARCWFAGAEVAPGRADHRGHTRDRPGGRYGTELPVQRDDELGRLADCPSTSCHRRSAAAKKCSRSSSRPSRMSCARP